MILSIRSGLGLVLLLCFAAFTAPAVHAAGDTVLTVIGDIEKPNRGPLDPFEDAFLEQFGVAFDRARAFDREALRALGLHKVVATYPGTGTTVEAEGPLLRDVLAAAGATGDTATVFALDGYSADIPAGDFERWPVILALKSGGEWLGIGGRGPGWVVYPRDGDPALAARDDSRWVWGVFLIRVE